MSNTWITCPLAEDNYSKEWLILHTSIGTVVLIEKDLSLKERSAGHQLDGGVTAYHGKDV